MRLPDRWGNALTDAWLAARGRGPDSFSIVDRLCYIGSRGMGALEFEPAVDTEGVDPDADLQVAALVRLANEALSQREEFVTELSAHPEEEAMRAILAIGTSAGGARPKAIIAYDEVTGQVRSGQVAAGPGCGYWLLKFDGVARSGDRGLVDPDGWGAIEYAYALMAQEAGVIMSECRLLEENGRRHFMTRRFDRTESGGKLHMQTIGALEQVSYNEPGAYSYERVLILMRRLGLGTPQLEQQFRRMVFNVVARNQDDHVKNISLLMDRTGQWSLSPAYDLTYANDPANRWFNSHQMTINAKRDDFTVGDLKQVARVADLPARRHEAILGEVTEAVGRWSQIARDVGVDADRTRQIAAGHRLRLPAS
jgi:serine/threonine-protein kinase HipA